MSMKRFGLFMWIGMIVLVVGGGPLTAQQAKKPEAAVSAEEESMGLKRVEIEGRQQVIYVVQTGDTMWEIAKRFMNSPYYWAKIWEHNDFIINPNLIYPGDVLVLYPAGEVISSGVVEAGIFPATPSGPMSEVKGFGAKAPGEKKLARIVYKHTDSIGFISMSEMEATGTIIDSFVGDLLGNKKLKKELLGTYDMVYVNVGTITGVKEGDIFSIFRLSQDAEGKTKAVRHPVTNEVLGYRMIALGQLKIKKMNENAAEAEIINSYENIKVGDRISPYVNDVSEVIDVRGSDVDIIGSIIACRNQTVQFGQDDIVYIDRGKKDGVVTGVLFQIYVPGIQVNDPDVGQKTTLPDKVLGTLVVVDTKETTSTAMIVESIQELIPGEAIRTVQP